MDHTDMCAKLLLLVSLFQAFPTMICALAWSSQLKGIAAIIQIWLVPRVILFCNCNSAVIGHCLWTSYKHAYCSLLGMLCNDRIKNLANGGSTILYLYASRCFYCSHLKRLKSLLPSSEIKEGIYLELMSNKAQNSVQGQQGTAFSYRHVLTLT